MKSLANAALQESLSTIINLYVQEARNFNAKLKNILYILFKLIVFIYYIFKQFKSTIDQETDAKQTIRQR